MAKICPECGKEYWGLLGIGGYLGGKELCPDCYDKLWPERDKYGKKQSLENEGGTLETTCAANDNGTREGHKLCPLCAEEIKEDAIKCKHCGSIIAASAGKISGLAIFSLVWLFFCAAVAVLVGWELMNIPKGMLVYKYEGRSGVATGWFIMSMLPTGIGLAAAWKASRRIQESGGMLAGKAASTFSYILGWILISGEVLFLLSILAFVPSAN